MDKVGEPPVKARMSLDGLDGNAFVILGTVTRQLRRAGATPEQVKQFQGEATSGDYDHLLQTVMAWTEEPEE